MRPFIIASWAFLFLFAFTRAFAGEPHSCLLNGAEYEFIENRGQVIDVAGNKRPEVLYTARLGNVDLFFTTNAVYYVFSKYEKSEKSHQIGNPAPPKYFISELY